MVWVQLPLSTTQLCLQPFITMYCFCILRDLRIIQKRSNVASLSKFIAICTQNLQACDLTATAIGIAYFGPHRFSTLWKLQEEQWHTSSLSSFARSLVAEQQPGLAGMKYPGFAASHKLMDIVDKAFRLSSW